MKISSLGRNPFGTNLYWGYWLGYEGIPFLVENLDYEYCHGQHMGKWSNAGAGIQGNHTW